MNEKQEQIALWRLHIQEWKAKGLSVVEWCELQGISKGIYNYRRKVVYKADADAGLRPLRTTKHITYLSLTREIYFPESQKNLHPR